MTLSRVAAETLAPGVKVRDTAEIETPARPATCCAVTLLLLTTPLTVGSVDHPPSSSLGATYSMPTKDLSFGPSFVNRQCLGKFELLSASDHWQKEFCSYPKLRSFASLVPLQFGSGFAHDQLHGSTRTRAFSVAPIIGGADQSQ